MSKYIDEVKFLNNILCNLNIAIVLNKIIISYLANKREHFKTIICQKIYSMNMNNDGLRICTQFSLPQKEYIWKNEVLTPCLEKYDFTNYIQINDCNMSDVQVALRGMTHIIDNSFNFIFNKDHIFFSKYEGNSRMNCVCVMDLKTEEYEKITDGICMDIYNNMLVIINNNNGKLSLHDYKVNLEGKIICTQKISTYFSDRISCACYYDNEIYVLISSPTICTTIFVLDFNTLLEKRRIVFSDNIVIQQTGTKRLIVTDDLIFLNTNDYVMVLARENVITEEKKTYINVKPKTLDRIRKRQQFGQKK